MFDSKEEIQEVDTEKLLCIDLEKLGSLKEKTSKIIEFVNYNDDINENDKNKALESFNDKIEEIKNTEDEINNIISNLSSIDKIVYGPEETKVIFKK